MATEPMPGLPAPDGSPSLEIVREDGGQPTTVFAHSAGGSIAETTAIGKHVAGRRIHFHFPGYGTSPRPRRPLNLDQLARCLHHMLTAHVATQAVSISLGTSALLRLLARHPHALRRAVLVLPFTLDQLAPPSIREHYDACLAAGRAGDAGGMLELLRTSTPDSLHHSPALARHARALTEQRIPDLLSNVSGFTKRRLHELVAVSGLLDHLVRLQPAVASDEQLLTVHTEDYLQRLSAQSDGVGGDAGDGISPFGAGGLDILRRAAGGAISAVEAVVDATVRNSYALARPSGHHALPDHGMGMAYLANVAIAAHHAKALGIERIAIVDWDAHHGNGTQHAFEQDPGVLTISLHQENCFPPGSGDISERGVGPGYGSAVNVPLPAGTGNGGYDFAFTEVVVPALDRFHPELIIVASGFDAGAMDPLARQLVSSSGFRAMARHVLDAADRLCSGRVSMIHEGGYSEVYVPFCGHAVIEEMTGRHLLEDPYLELVDGFGGQQLQPHQRAAVEQAARLAAEVPTPTTAKTA
ncbi:hypothetical protein AB5L52_09640 [Streptomyces sp. CG4]|uniref:hypothetical protein n=1 Tax=Streptomyces sp. CG4 TaxID=408783 RepID=UPI0034E2B555